ncbi:TonB-dependent receptor [Altererythrobacter sp. B11]|uniref:TonB-dependent receptor n=1 Tax=Altererythrobacter sp. B11 TaxID=2060312 RepID=UPI001E3EA82C|nr:TonB-dependent receptor [Altererythrobacter sp. B11]
MTLDVPAGSAADAAVVIARQTGISIVIADSAVAKRRVGPWRGTFTPQQAVERLARAAGARAIPVGTLGWRLVAREAGASPRRAAPSAPPPPPPPPEAVGAPILVVASKRDTPLAELAGQVSILDGEELTFGGVGGTEKISQRLATVSSTHLGSGRNKLFIRGIADSSFTGPTQATVGQYLGDLRISYNAPDPDLRLSDLERVEVMEGPQGTLYGAGSLGGIIRMVPNAPEPGVFVASAMVGGSATQHGAPGGDASAMMNLPFAGENGALRLSLDAESQGGYIDKPAMGRDDVNRTTILGGRAAARMRIAPDWTVDVIAVGQSNRGRDSQYTDRGGPPLQSASPMQEGFDADYAQAQLVVSGLIGDIHFRSSTGRTWQQLEERYDATLPDMEPRLFTQNNDTRMFANETRLWQPLGDQFGWLLGASYTHNSTQLTRELETEAVVTSTAGVRNVVDEITVYGEASLRLSDGLIATGGARITDSHLGGAGEDIAPMLAAELRGVTADRGETVFLPSGSLVATVLPRTNLYLRYQEGFRPGGLSIDGEIVRRFRNDHVRTFEVGARHGQPGRGDFDLAASISYTRWDDIQADFIDRSGFPSTANIGDGRIWSLTLAGGVRLMPGLRLDAGISYNDSEVSEPDFLFVSLASLPAVAAPELPVGTVVSDLGQQRYAAASQLGRVPNIADISARAGFSWDRPLTDTLDLSARGWASYIGKSRLGIGPELGALQGGYVDSGLTVRIGRPTLGISVGLANIADVQGNRFALGTPFAIGREQITPLRPRTVRIGLDASW